nr:386_t:CDS:2 [Entrophospora candida]
MTSTTTKPIIDSNANWSTITEEFAKKMGVEIIGNSHKSHNTNRAISGIVKQVSANPDIPRRNHTPSESSNDVDEITKGMAGLSINDSSSSSNS